MEFDQLARNTGIFVARQYFLHDRIFGPSDGVLLDFEEDSINFPDRRPGGQLKPAAQVVHDGILAYPDGDEPDDG